MVLWGFGVEKVAGCGAFRVQGFRGLGVLGLGV